MTAYAPDLFAYRERYPETLSDGIEEWRAVPGYEGLYEVSSFGRVRSLPRATTSGKILRLDLNGLALKARLSKNNIRKSFTAHKLVMWAFVGPMPPDKQLIAHWDGDFRNNRISNLRYATHLENEADKRRHDREAKGERNPACKLTASDVEAIRKMRGLGCSVEKIVEHFPVGRRHIYNITRGDCWSDEGNAARRIARRAKKNRPALIRDTGQRRVDPETGKACVVWEIVG
jgi:hypothetical protein